MTDAELACIAVAQVLLRLMDATPVAYGQSAVTARRSDLYGHAGYGYTVIWFNWLIGARSSDPSPPTTTFNFAGTTSSI